MNPFIKNLTPCKTLSEALNKKASVSLPADWFVIVTDIVNSTQAIQEGKYKDVNTVGVCSIVAVLNSLNKEVVPYVFGGDGASFCIPKNKLSKVIEALRGCQTFSKTSFQLELRVGIVPYSTIHHEAPIYVSKFIKSDYLIQSVFTGGGLSLADQLIKQNPDLLIHPLHNNHQVDFSGFECRWNEIKTQEDFTISLLVQLNTSKNTNKATGSASLRALLDQIEIILGSEDLHHPVTKEQLQLTLNPKKLMAEAKSKTYTNNRHYFSIILKLIMQALIGKAFMWLSLKTGKIKWGNYKDDFIKNSDYKKVDDAIRMTFSISEEKLAELEAFLDHGYNNQLLFYGMHKTDSAIATCMIEKTGDKHMHFIDANHGGYALAAKKLKHQIKSA